MPKKLQTFTNIEDYTTHLKGHGAVYRLYDQKGRELQRAVGRDWDRFKEGGANLVKIEARLKNQAT